MDMNDRVEFVALTKEEVETMIAKAALAGASVAADTLQKAHQKEQKELKDRRLHNTRLLLRNYRMLKESCTKAVYQKEHSEKSTAEVIEDLMSMKASDGVIVNSIKESAERTGIIISHVDRMLDVYRMYCGKYSEKEKRQYKVIKSMYITKERNISYDLLKLNLHLTIRFHFQELRDFCHFFSLAFSFLPAVAFFSRIKVATAVGTNVTVHVFSHLPLS